MPTHTVFITGTDTGVGKTFVSCALARGAVYWGKKVAVVKPVAAGCEWLDEQWKNDDALALQQAAGNWQDYRSINPYALPAAVAPHIAAQEAHIELDVKVITSHIKAVQNSAVDLCVIEGAGGFLVPLNSQQNFADIAVALRCPIILVVAMRLGCINHALLSAEAIRARGLNLLGWVANQAQAEPMSRHQQNIAYLSDTLHAPRLAEFSWGGDNAAIDQHFFASVLKHLNKPPHN